MQGRDPAARRRLQPCTPRKANTERKCALQSRDLYLEKNYWRNDGPQDRCMCHTLIRKGIGRGSFLDVSPIERASVPLHPFIQSKLLYTSHSSPEKTKQKNQYMSFGRCRAHDLFFSFFRTWKRQLRTLQLLMIRRHVSTRTMEGQRGYKTNQIRACLTCSTTSST